MELKSQIGTTRGLVPTVGRVSCKGAGVGSTPTSSSKDLTAGWRSPECRQAHNLEIAGSKPAPTTNFRQRSFTDIPAGNPMGMVAFEATRPDQHSRQA